MQHPKTIQLPFTSVSIDSAFWAPRIAVNRARGLSRPSTASSRKAGLTTGGNRHPAATGAGEKAFPSMWPRWVNGLKRSPMSSSATPTRAGQKKSARSFPTLSAGTDFCAVFAGSTLGDSPGKKYFAGHLIEAAIAWHRATGKTDFIARLRGYADRLAAAADAGGQGLPH